MKRKCAVVWLQLIPKEMKELAHRRVQCLGVFSQNQTITINIQIINK